MHLITQQLKRIRILVLLSLFILGTVLAVLPFFGPGECPGSYTQQEIDSSGCYVGADMSGISVFLGLFILLTAGYAIFTSVLFARKKFSAPAKTAIVFGYVPFMGLLLLLLIAVSSVLAG